MEDSKYVAHYRFPDTHVMCYRGAYWTQNVDEHDKLNMRRKSENYKTGESKYMRQKIEVNVSFCLFLTTANHS